MPQPCAEQSVQSVSVGQHRRRVRDVNDASTVGALLPTNAEVSIAEIVASQQRTGADNFMQQKRAMLVVRSACLSRASPGDGSM